VKLQFAVNLMALLPLFTEVTCPAVRKHRSRKEIESEKKFMNASNDKLIG